MNKGRSTLFMLAAIACSSRSQDSMVTGRERLSDCDDYVVEYRRCTALSAGDEIAAQRTKTLAATFLSNGSLDASIQEAQSARCREGARQLRASCR